MLDGFLQMRDTLSSTQHVSLYYCSFFFFLLQFTFSFFVLCVVEFFFIEKFPSVCTVFFFFFLQFFVAVLIYLEVSKLETHYIRGLLIVNDLFSFFLLLVIFHESQMLYIYYLDRYHVVRMTHSRAIFSPKSKINYKRYHECSVCSYIIRRGHSSIREKKLNEREKNR